MASEEGGGEKVLAAGRPLRASKESSRIMVAVGGFGIDGAAGVIRRGIPLGHTAGFRDNEGHTKVVFLSVFGGVV
jgi:hypothetical protein